MRRFLKGFAMGALAGGLFLAALLILDIGGFGTLISRDRAAFAAIALLLLNFCGLFGIVIAASSGAGSPRAGRRLPALSPNLRIQRWDMKLTARQDRCINSNHPSA